MIDLIDREFILKYRAEILFAVILVLSAFLNLWNIWNQVMTNAYYAAAVKSMLINPRIAFFNSFDPAGFVTVDKPPVGLWVQALFAAVLGFNSWVLILPQALAGIGSVALIYFIVSHPFGKPSGLVAALVLAITPIFVAISRNGTMDTQLIFVILLAVWVALMAAQERSLPWLLLSVVLIGIGFNIKMIQSFIVVPAILTVYFLGTIAFPFKKRILHLLIAVLVLLAVSLSWAVAVDMIPANQRPYIGGSGDNTVLGLIVNYNGLERLESNQSSGNVGYGVGTPGITRLFGKGLAGQFSWLLPLALIGLLAVRQKPASLNFKEIDCQRMASEGRFTIVALLLWLVPALLYFSFTTGFWQIYYIATIAPPLAGLVGIGAVAMYREYPNGGWRGWLLIMAILATGLLQALFLSYDAEWSGLLTPLVLLGSIGCAGMLTIMKAQKYASRRKSQKYLIIIALAILFIAPFVWSCTPMIYGAGNILQPTAGPPNPRMSSGMAPGTKSISGLSEYSSTQLKEYLLTHKTNESWILAVPSADYGANLIIETGRPVMSLGGYFGTDHILTVPALVTLIKEGKVRFFLPWRMGGPAGRMSPGSSDIFRWVSAHCTALNLNNGNETVVNWTSSTTSLFDCAKAASPE